VKHFCDYCGDPISYWGICLSAGRIKSRKRTARFKRKSGREIWRRNNMTNSHQLIIAIGVVICVLIGAVCATVATWRD